MALVTDVLLRKVHVLDPGGPFHEKEVDIAVRKGRIAQIGARLAKEGLVEVRHPNLHVSLGWCDLRAHLREPGEEHKEGITNGLDAAAEGGFTHVAVLPSTNPPIDGRSGVEYLLRKAEGHAVRLLPLGALTAGLRGEQLAELLDMHQAGAVAFSNDQSPLRTPRLLLLALQYVQPFSGLVMTWPLEPAFAVQGQMHEGAMSVRLGMRGIPAMAETVALARDLAVLEYSGGRLHVPTISTSGAVELLRQAKKAGLQVTASVAAHNLLLDDGCLRGFDSHYKVLPPLRDASHMEALREGLKDGTIDCVVSDHRPEDAEHKGLEFGLAAFGAAGLETAYAVANTALKGGVPTRRVVDRFCAGPRRVMGLPTPHLEPGTQADLTLFDPDAEWEVDEKAFRTRGRNSPFARYRLTGRPMGIYANGSWVPGRALANT
jgi:dihydroorotase